MNGRSIVTYAAALLLGAAAAHAEVKTTTGRGQGAAGFKFYSVPAP